MQCPVVWVPTSLVADRSWVAFVYARSAHAAFGVGANASAPKFPSGRNSRAASKRCDQVLGVTCLRGVVRMEWRGGSRFSCNLASLVPADYSTAE